MTYTIKQLATISGQSVRTLHYYDQIGLLQPSRNPANGYRHYNQTDLLKLQHIVFFRELGLPLAQIRTIIHDPHFDPIAALQDHRQLLVLKQASIKKQLLTLDTTINALKGGEAMSSQKTFTPVSDKQLHDYQEEAKARWGHTTAWKQSQQRTENWTKDMYDQVKTEFDAILKSITSLIELNPASQPVQNEIKKYWQHLNLFYTMTPEIFQGLAETYVEDPRFKATFDQYHPHLAAFMTRAMKAYVKSNFT